jgi:hypothetical protein
LPITVRHGSHAARRRQSRQAAAAQPCAPLQRAPRRGAFISQRCLPTRQHFAVIDNRQPRWLDGVHAAAFAPPRTATIESLIRGRAITATSPPEAWLAAAAAAPLQR